MDKKQYVEKGLKEFDELAEKKWHLSDGDRESIRYLFHTMLSECWDMAGEEIKTETKLILKNAEDKQKEMLEKDEKARNIFKACPDSIKALEIVKLNEGTTAHYYAGQLEGAIYTAQKILNSLTSKQEDKT